MTGLTVANTSQHRAAPGGARDSRKEAQRVYYTIAGDDVVQMCRLLRSVAEHRLAEVDKLVRDFIGHRDELEPVPAAEVLDRAKRGLVLVLDVRPPEEYAAGHLPGVNIRSSSRNRLAELPKRGDRAYCRGPTSVIRRRGQAARRGLRARRLQMVPGWKAAAAGRAVSASVSRMKRIAAASTSLRALCIG
jgi:rhodanese-related sulfurtransferase